MTHSTWIDDLFAAIDRMDVPGFASFFADDGRFRFGNAPAAQGRSAIEKAVAGFFETIRGLSHELTGVWEPDPRSVIVEGSVTYTRHDGSTVSLPFADVFHLREPSASVPDDEPGRGRIRDYLIYMDIAPLYEPRPAAA